MKQSILHTFEVYRHGNNPDEFEDFLNNVIFKLSSDDLSILLVKNMDCEQDLTFDLIKRLVENGANPRYKNDKPFLKACRYGTLEMIQYFLDCGADINVYGGLGLVNVVNSEILFPGEQPDMKKVHFLIENGIKISPVLIHEVCTSLLPDMVKLLLEHGVNPNTMLKYLFSVSSLTKGDRYERIPPNNLDFALCMKLINDSDPNYGLVIDEIISTSKSKRYYDYYDMSEFSDDLFDTAETDDENEPEEVDEENEQEEDQPSPKPVRKRLVAVVESDNEDDDE